MLKTTGRFFKGRLLLASRSWKWVHLGRCWCKLNIKVSDCGHWSLVDVHHKFKIALLAPSITLGYWSRHINCFKPSSLSRVHNLQWVIKALVDSSLEPPCYSFLRECNSAPCLVTYPKIMNLFFRRQTRQTEYSLAVDHLYYCWSMGITQWNDHRA